ncbi:MAG TPA: low temperature requirement protein A [Azospirillum sp.]|nr:low temperature requirement protein A [Azospirillum sp.]
MTAQGHRNGFLRVRGEREHAKVDFVELFFDLVFVFAVTQLSHGLIGHYTLLGALQTALLLLAVWWVWIYTAWWTNWVDPARRPVRFILFVLMLAGLVLSTSIPQAFSSRGLAFAGAYVFMQVGRTAAMLWLTARRRPGLNRNFQRVFAWFVLSGAFWVAGGIADEGARFALWVLALVLEYAAPAFGFWTPGLGRSTTQEWNVEPGHMAERCGLFIIIALGESILVTGATYADLEITVPTMAAFVVAFVGSLAMWWIYFDTGARRVGHRFSTSDDPGRLARIAYTYLHVPLVAGIILGAVADEFILMHPGGHDGHTDAGTMAAIIGGPAVFLVGNILFKRTAARWLPLSHLVGLGLLAPLVPVASAISPLMLAAAATAVLVVVAIWEFVSLRTRESEWAEH